MNRFFINAIITAVSAYVLVVALLLAALIMGGINSAEFSEWAMKVALVDAVLLLGALIVGGLMHIVPKK